VAGEDAVEVMGAAIESLPDAPLRVELTQMDIASLPSFSGKMQLHLNRILLGEQDLLERRSYDLTKRRTTFRQK
jgi:translation initiation factor IF-1